MPPGGRSVTVEVDLDVVAAGYAHRSPHPGMLSMARHLAVAALLDPGEWALDLGGGYGHHAATWLELGLKPIVVDPSSPMRDQARQRKGVAVVGGRAERLPFARATIGFAYAHLSIHYVDWPMALREMIRVLRSGGSLAIGTFGRRHHDTSFLSRWFPSVGPADGERFPEPDVLARTLADLGATNVRIEANDLTKTWPAAQWRAATESRFVSSLQLVPPAELAAGLERFDEAFPNPGDKVSYVMRYDWVRGTRR